MISLLLALSLGQTYTIEPEPLDFVAPRSREYRTGGAPRISRLGQGGGLADFEAFGTGYAAVGAGEPCPLPNWALHSEALTNAQWQLQQSVTPITRTADYANGPTGTLTAERLEIPATSGAGYSLLYQSTSPAPDLVAYTFSVYIKGTSTGGDISITPYSGAAWYESRCTFNATTWTRCEKTITSAGTPQWAIGNQSFTSGTARAAIDVLAWGMMINEGSSAAPYIATGAAALGFNPSGARGEVFALARASTATCSKQGPALTGILNTDMVLLPANSPRMESNGVDLSLLTEGARVNYFIKSEKFDAAATWVPYADVVAVPVVTADQATSPRNTLTADKVVLAATGATESSVVRQLSACSTGVECAVSVYVKGVSGVSDTGTLDVCAGTAGSNCMPCTFTSASWTRCIRTGVSATVTTAYIGNASLYNGGTVRPAQSVYLWGAQAEVAVTFASSYIPTDTVTVTRAEEVTARFTLAANQSLGSLSGTVLPRGWPANSILATAYLATSDLWEPYFYNTSGNMQGFTYIASTVDAVNAAATMTAYVPNRWAMWRSAVPELCASVNGETGVCNGVGVGATIKPTYLYTGTYYAAASATSWGWHSRICLDDDPTRCR